MLKELRIKNLAIIDDLTVRFEKGLNILSGETGAGKSIIVDALGLALGDRAQSDLIKSGESNASVQAYFELDDYRAIPDIGIDVTEGLLLRRVLTSGGKSRAYVNDTMVTLQALSEISSSLVDIHSQHEHQSLLTPEKQRTLLDYYGKLSEKVAEVRRLYADVQNLHRSYNALRETVKTQAERIDLLTFQVNEIAAATLKPGERESLEAEQLLLANQHRLIELVDRTYGLLYEAENSCTEQLSEVLRHVQEMKSMDASISETLELLESAKPLIQDASAELRGYRDRYDFEPGRLEIVEDRLDLIKNMERKYGKGIAAILAYEEKAKKELKSFGSSDERLTELQKEIAARETALERAAEDLSDKRKKTAKKIEKLVKNNLSELSIEKAGFSVDVRQEKEEGGAFRIGPHGIDRITFLFSANPGEPLKPLSRIVSGGELSRVMLALKTILADVDNVPVLIFDEVDAGIGGRTAESVGKKLDLISEKHQLLCITHLPQIARFGDFHLKIEKQEKNNRVYVYLKELRDNERKDEIARMLSGKVTEISRKHAKELLDRSG
ncbi:MAG: DNA repair protein RecN [Nitrospiraceae bacterium]|nr:MAG: DNA repair protein RecN [Nitrospiraceae bacterium]